MTYTSITTFGPVRATNRDLVYAALVLLGQQRAAISISVPDRSSRISELLAATSAGYDTLLFAGA